MEKIITINLQEMKTGFLKEKLLQAQNSVGSHWKTGLDSDVNTPVDEHGQLDYRDSKPSFLFILAGRSNLPGMAPSLLLLSILLALQKLPGIFLPAISFSDKWVHREIALLQNPQYLIFMHNHRKTNQNTSYFTEQSINTRKSTRQSLSLIQRVRRGKEVCR